MRSAPASTHLTNRKPEFRPAGRQCSRGYAYSFWRRGRTRRLARIHRRRTASALRGDFPRRLLLTFPSRPRWAMTDLRVVHGGRPGTWLQLEVVILASLVIEERSPLCL